MIIIEDNTTALTPKVLIGGKSFTEGNVSWSKYVPKEKGRTRTTRNIYHGYGIDTSVRRVFRGEVSQEFVFFIDQDTKQLIVVEGLVRNVIDLLKTGLIDQSVYLIFKSINNWVTDKSISIDAVDLLIKRSELNSWGEDVLIALLSTTLPYKDVLVNRSHLFQTVKERLLILYKNDLKEVNYILHGLD